MKENLKYLNYYIVTNLHLIYMYS